MRTSSLPTLAAALLLILGVPASAQAPKEPAQVIRQILEGVRGVGDTLRAGRELAALGSAGLEPLFASFAAGQGSLSAPQTVALTSAIGTLPRDEVLSFLGRVARSTQGERERGAACELLASFGSKNELKLALELASPGKDDVPLAPELRESLEKALVGICEREEGAAFTLAGFFGGVSPALQASIVTALSRAGGAQAARLLATLLGEAGPEGDAMLLLELGNHAKRYGDCDDKLVLERVRGYLGHPERRLGILACLALEKLRDYEAVPDLVVLLDDPNPALSRGVHSALHSLTGLTYGPETEPWMAWLSESLAWWEERADAVRAALVSGEPAEAAAALSEASRQRLYIADVVQILELGLQRTEPDLVRTACRALGAIREPCVIRALEGALDQVDPTAGEEIQKTLMRVARPRAQAHRPTHMPTIPRNVNP